MKRYWLLAILLTVLTACTVEVVDPPTPEVTVTPATANVAPGGQVEFAATVDDTRATDFEWELVGESFSFVSLESDLSRIRVTAPSAEGEYTLRATTTDFESEAGEATLRVNRLLAAPSLEAISAPRGPAAGQALRSGTLQAGDTTDFAIVVTADIAESGSALFFEATQSSGTGLTLTTFSSDLSVYASSSAPNLFVSGALDESLLSPQGIAESYVCLGPCVARDSQEETFYVRLTNTSSVSINYSLFAYVKNYDDTGEDENDQVATAIDLTTSDTGAIESLGDVDFYDIQSAGTLRFNNTTQVDTIAVVRDAQGNEIFRLRNGEMRAVSVGQRLEVKSESDERAAPAGASTYGLEIQ
jgi:hypothetical protein